LLLVACSRPRNPQSEFDAAYHLFLTGNLPAAQRRAEGAWHSYAGRDALWEWKFRLLDARILTWRGMYNDVFTVLGPRWPANFTNQNLNLEWRELEGLAFARVHRFADADRDLISAEQDCRQSGSDLIDEVIIAEGSLAVERGEYEQAQKLFENSLQLARKHNHRFFEAVALLKLSNTALLREHFDEAIDWSNAAYNAGKSLDAQLIVEIVEGNQGWAYYKTGDPERASSLFLDAYKNAEQLGDLFDQVKWLTTTGYIEFDEGNFSAAEDHYQRALDLARKTSVKESISDALVSLSFVAVQTGHEDLAKNYSHEAIRMARADGNRSDELYPLLAAGQIAAREHDSAQAESIFLEVANDPKVDPSLKWEAQHELATLYVDEKRFADAAKAYRNAIAAFETARSALQHEETELPFLSNAATLYDDYIHFLVNRQEIEHALQIADYSRARTLAEGLGVLSQAGSLNAADLDSRAVAKRLGETLLFYCLGSQRSYLWVVTSREIHLFILPPAGEINDLVHRYRQSLAAGRDPLETVNPDGRKLFDLLVGPAAKLIAQGSRLIVIPDESLNDLNFETLLVSNPKPHYWIEDVTISDAASIRLLAAAHKRGRVKLGSLLLIGNALIPDSNYAELPNAKAEMASIERHFTLADETIYERDRATPGAYLAGHPEHFAYIHFVSHATASRVIPLDSAIVLSADSAPNSFKLYARDIIQHPVDAELVTVSTCYGSGTRTYAGEGLVGLSWAFLRAGAHRVIGALWEVSDASTPQLMDKFYGQLEQGRSPEASLRSAKLSLLHSSGVFRKPFYWAPFQMYLGS
jgi:CHAT domain-containing protein/Tfp pilus assembly protein PilF